MEQEQKKQEQLKQQNQKQEQEEQEQEQEQHCPGESDVEIQDSVRGKNVYIVQSSGRDTNNHLMGLILFIQVCRGTSSSRERTRGRSKS